MNDFQVKGLTCRVVIITSGTRGLGRGIVIAVRDVACGVGAVHCNRDDAVQDFERGTGIAIFRWNVSNSEQCRTGVATASAVIGDIDVLVNNAGITRDKVFHRMAPENPLYRFKPYYRQQHDAGSGKQQAGVRPASSHSSTDSPVSIDSSTVKMDVARRSMSASMRSPSDTSTISSRTSSRKASSDHSARHG